MENLMENIDPRYRIIPQKLQELGYHLSARHPGLP